MKNSIFLVAAGCVMFLSACSSFTGNSAPMMTSSKSADSVNTTGEDGQQFAPPAFTQFSDIPIPEQADMDLQRSLVFGGQNQWSGRLVFTAPYSHGGLFDFYMAEMPKFGWQEITVVRSKVSVLSFKQADRIATIQIEGDTMGAEVMFTVSPSHNKTKH